MFNTCHELISHVFNKYKYHGKNTLASERIKKRVMTPADNFKYYLRTYDFKYEIATTTQYLKRLINNPIYEYIKFVEKLKKYGSCASCKEEFAGSVGILIKFIFQSKEFIEFINSSNELKIYQDIIINDLVAIHIEGRYSYPYEATIYIIYELLKLIDIYYRSKSQQNTFYHSFRYKMYLDYLLNAEFPNVIVIPAAIPLTFIDFIKLRCIPVYLLGVSTEPVYADQYLNTPLDFFAHDIQHSRRLLIETDRYYEVLIKNIFYQTDRSNFSIISKLDFYKYMWDFTKKILKIVGSNKTKQLIIFEIIHEKAWPITRHSIIRNIQIGYDKFPVEELKVTKTGKVYINNFIFDDPTPLANLYYKLVHGFIDMPPAESNLTNKTKKTYTYLTNSMITKKTKKRLNTVLPISKRTAENIATEAHNILIKLNATHPKSYAELLKLTLDTQNTDELRQFKYIGPKKHHKPMRYNSGSLKEWDIIKKGDDLPNVNEFTKYKMQEDIDTVYTED